MGYDDDDEDGDEDLDGYDSCVESDEAPLRYDSDVDSAERMEEEERQKRWVAREGRRLRLGTAVSAGVKGGGLGVYQIYKWLVYGVRHMRGMVELDVQRCDADVDSAEWQAKRDLKKRWVASEGRRLSLGAAVSAGAGIVGVGYSGVLGFWDWGDQGCLWGLLVFGFGRRRGSVVRKWCVGLRWAGSG